VDDFIGELLDRIDASGQNFSQSAYEALSQDLEPLLRLLFVLAVLFYGVQLFLGTSRLSVAEIIGRLVRIFVILILVGTWSNFNDLVYDWLTTVPEAAGRAILAASGTGVTEPTNGLSQIWKTANTAAAAFSEQAGYLSVLPALIGMIIMVFAGLFVAIALGILVLAKVVLWVLTTIDSISGNRELKLSDFAAFIMLCLAGSFVLLQVQSLAQGIAGGLATPIGPRSRQMTTRGIFWSREAIGQSARQTRAAVHRVQARLHSPRQDGAGASMQRAITSNGTPRQT
jgi:type IV secretion system protein VirB6